MEKKEKQKPINLTDALVKSLPTKDVDYWVSDITPGLKLRVWPKSGEKVWYFRYRPKDKGPQRIQLGSFRLLSVRGQDIEPRKHNRIYLITLIRGNTKHRTWTCRP